MGDIYFKLNQFEKAIEEYENSVKFQSEELNFHYEDLALAYLQVNRIDDAIFAFKKAIEIDQENDHDLDHLSFISIEKLGKIYFDLNDWENSLFYFNKAKLIFPYNSFYYKMTGDIYSNLGKNEEANKEYKIASRLENNYQKNDQENNKENENNQENDQEKNKFIQTINGHLKKGIILENKIFKSTEIELKKNKKRSVFIGGEFSVDSHFQFQILFQKGNNSNGSIGAGFYDQSYLENSNNDDDRNQDIPTYSKINSGFYGFFIDGKIFNSSDEKLNNIFAFDNYFNNKNENNNKNNNNNNKNKNKKNNFNNKKEEIIFTIKYSNFKLKLFKEEKEIYSLNIPKYINEKIQPVVLLNGENDQITLLLDDYYWKNKILTKRGLNIIPDQFSNFNGDQIIEIDEKNSSVCFFFLLLLLFNYYFNYYHYLKLILSFIIIMIIYYYYYYYYYY